jgi:hypothetical protein
MAEITDALVKEIRIVYGRSCYKRTKLAELFDVPLRAINKVIAGWTAAEIRERRKPCHTTEKQPPYRGMTRLKMTARELKSFKSKIAWDGHCWLWTGGHNADGYGKFQFCGRGTPAHRVAYMHWKGEIPFGYVVDHLCSNPRCVNPEHLEPVTHQENIARYWAWKRRQVS